MDHESLVIEEVRKRAADPTTRTDLDTGGSPGLAPLATAAEIAHAEQIMGCKLHPLHRRLLQEVGNGGFGPGDGLIGVPGGRTDDDGRSVVELRQALFGDSMSDAAVERVVPLWDWGDGAWACLDEGSGIVLVVDEYGITDTGFTLSTCIAQWAAGTDLADKIFTFEEHSGVNPFTKQPMTARFRGLAVGKPYSPEKSATK